MMRNKLKVLLTLALMVLTILPALAAPKKISYQGKLTDATGNPIDSSGQPITVTFRLYNVPLGGTALWQENQGVVFTGGLFNVSLGSVSSLDTLLFNEQYYLGIQMAGDQEMLPRQPLNASAYALGSQGDFTVKHDLSVGGNFNLLPPGIIMAYGGISAPTGWFICDGSTVSRSGYSALFAGIGTRFGAGDGSTTFNLPDFRGRFLRGRDNGAGRDPDRTARTAMAAGGSTGDNVGSIQGDQFAQHRHNITHEFIWVPNQPIAFRVLSSPSGSLYDFGDTSSSGGNETRPSNAYVNYIIKY